MAALENWPVIVDDSGTKQDGTIFNKALFDAILASINAEIASATNPSEHLDDIIDEIVEARGDAASIGDRLDVFLDPDGNPGTLDGLDITGTAGENLTAGDLCYLSDGSGGGSTGRWYKANATYPYASLHPQLAFALETLIAAQSGSFRRDGLITGLSGLVAGTRYYVSGTTAGGLVSTIPAPPAYRRYVGEADTSSSLIIDCEMEHEYLTQLIETLGSVGTTETTIKTLVFPAKTLKTENDRAVIILWGRVSATNVLKTIKVKIGAASFTAYSDTQATSGTWQVCVILIRRSDGAQIVLLSGTGSGGTAAMLSNNGTAGEDLTADFNITVTGQGGPGAVDDDIQCDGGFVKRG